MAEAMTGRFGRLNGRVATWLARIAAIILGAMAVLTFADVIGRYVFNHPLTISIEFTELIVFLTVGLVTHQREHVSVDFVTLRLPPKVRAAVDVIVNLISFGYLVVLVWRLGRHTLELYYVGDMTPSFFILFWPFGLIMTIASILVLTSTLLHIAHGVAGHPDAHVTNQGEI